MKKLMITGAVFLFSLILSVGCTSNDPQLYLEKLLDANIEKDFDTFLRYYLTWQLELAENPQKLKQLQDEFAQSCKDEFRVKSIEREGEPTIEEEEEDGEILKIETVRFKVVIERNGKEGTASIPLVKITKEIKRKHSGIQSKVGEWAGVK